MKTINFLTLFFCMSFATILVLNNHSTPKKTIHELQQEIATLQLIKDAVLEKYVPDSIKQASRDASYNLMYVDEGSNDYYAAKEQTWAVENYIKDCEPCMYVDNLLQIKKKEVRSLFK